MAGYIGSKASVVSSGAERKKVFDITTTTTSLTGCSYTPNQVHVFHNGVRLVDGTDYTATDGSTVTLTTAAQSGEEVVVISYATFQTSDTVSASAGGTFTGDVTFSGAFTSQGIDDNANATAMTIDSSENVLIGTTSTTIVGSGGLAAKPQGSGVRLDISNSGGSAMLLDRRTNDGDIVTFYKDGSTVGSIGTQGSVIRVGSGNTNVGFFTSGTVRIQPLDSSGTGNDASIDLGYSTSRFKNLYLSGGVYLGGTGAANYLDDYEEGGWTPTVTGESGGTMGLSGATGSYVKVGRMVTVNGFVSISSAGSASGTLQFSNLPFTVADTVGSTGIEASGSISFFDNLSTAVNSLTTNAIESTTNLRLFGQTSATQTNNQGITVAQVGSSNSNFRFSCTYFTS